MSAQLSSVSPRRQAPDCRTAVRIKRDEALAVLSA